MEIVRAIRRVGGKPRAMRDIVKACRRPPAVRPHDRNGGFPRLSGGPWLSDGARGYRCPASLRHALLAESLGNPSLWVIISAPWYDSILTFARGPIVVLPMTGPPILPSGVLSSNFHHKGARTRRDFDTCFVPSHLCSGPPVRLLVLSSGIIDPIGRPSEVSG